VIHKKEISHHNKTTKTESEISKTEKALLIKIMRKQDHQNETAA
jgi:hypothetical protein